ncbi:MAG: N-acetylmuramoyl-L-alanine amidase [Anaerovibrio sp.]|uniref:N-acetylmuramoyl-L-alanine amidase family protein n=1 Tax=Anaerovibrio sp. TaxID=1872532 RepID=UPI0025CE1A67|nr:N-acetylmuramoyl-L-alanine amidase [Anaerovibrio sp.]MCR5175545.1 N-acetylmuramoyl-L-alanine amidase [Anaerovibrio sp.]
MKQLIWKFTLAALCMVIFLAVGTGSCQALPRNEITSFHYSTYKDGDRNWLKIEIGLDRDKLDFEVSANPDRQNQLWVLMKNTDSGDVKKDIGLDRKIARYMTFRKKNKKDLQVMVAVDKSLDEQECRVYLSPPDKKIKETRLVIEIADSKAPEPVKDEKTNLPEDEILNNVAGATIVVDAGHGGSDTGAIGPNYLKEKDVTLNIALEMCRILKGNGARVLMSRYTDVDVFGPYATDRQELQARVDVAHNDPLSDIFVSIHCNAFTSPEANGTGTYYYPHSYNDSALAQFIQSEMVQATGLRDRGISSARFYVLRNSRIPAVLVETAFISNPHEEQMLSESRCQHAMALAICRGINAYFGNRIK